MVKFMIQFLFLLTYCMGNVSILQNGQCLEMWQQVHENSLKVRDWKTEEFLFAKFTKPVNWNRVSTVRKVEQKHASVTWVTKQNTDIKDVPNDCTKRTRNIGRRCCRPSGPTWWRTGGTVPTKSRQKFLPLALK